jgi:phage terminase large subunit GpA-like protein
MLLEKGYGGEAEWLPTVHGVDEDTRSFYINALYAPLGLKVTWKLLIKELLEAQDDASKMRVFANTRMAQTFSVKGEKPDHEKLWLRRENYARGTIQNGAALITAGVDVQKDRLEMEIVAWGKNWESWSVDYMVIQGDPMTDEPWLKLFDTFENQEFRHVNGAMMKIRTMAVDSGYLTTEVYKQCSRFPATRVMIVKGRDSQNRSIVQSKASIKRNGVVVGREIPFFNVGTNLLKEQLYGWLRAALPDDGEASPPGFCHWPEYDQEYFKGLASEQMVAKTVRGRLAYAWEKVHERNEPLDCRIYATAAAILNGLGDWSDNKWDQEMQPLTDGAPAPRVIQRAEPRAQRSSFINKSNDW